MKKSNPKRMKEGIVSALELPRDLAYKESILTLYGRTDLTIENYRSLILYQPDRILVLTQNGPLEILGKSMEISYYTSDEMKITGRICNLQWKNV
ncbi:MAG: YabP/YqfC family sporulation protein [Blautia sp.]|jgi:sporulation protein YqfC